MVYFIQGELTKMIKIGSCSNLEKRLKSLRFMSPDKLIVLGVRHELTFEDEKILHTKFYKHRAHGEWFTCYDELLEFIKGYAVPYVGEINKKKQLEEDLRMRLLLKGLGF